jgi:hypothetical protein
MGKRKWKTTNLRNKFKKTLIKWLGGYQAYPEVIIVYNSKWYLLGHLPALLLFSEDCEAN